MKFSPLVTATTGVCTENLNSDVMVMESAEANSRRVVIQ